MKKHNPFHLTLLALSFFIIMIAGCGHGKKGGFSTNGSSAGPITRQKSSTPTHIDIMITVKNWEIVQHRLMSRTEQLGNIRFAGRFLFNNDLVFKLKSDKVSNWYWFVKIPSVEKGIYEIRARPYREYSLDLKPVDAPEQFRLSIKIEGGYITGNYIVKSHPRWGQFQVSDYRAPFLYIRNDEYPDRVWAAKIPKEDGVWAVYVSLIR